MTANASDHRKTPSNIWEVTLMVRKRNAIGVFHPHVIQVRAWPDKVAEWAIDDANDLGFEVSHVVKAERLR